MNRNVKTLSKQMNCRRSTLPLLDRLVRSGFPPPFSSTPYAGMLPPSGFGTRITQVTRRNMHNPINHVKYYLCNEIAIFWLAETLATEFLSYTKCSSLYVLAFKCIERILLVSKVSNKTYIVQTSKCKRFSRLQGVLDRK